MKFFNIDLHISVISDISYILKRLGHIVTSWNISNAAWVFGMEPAKVDVVNQATWMSLDRKMCDQFYARYKDELSQYDAFIAAYPPSFAMLYEKFDKPVIIVAPIRYETPFSGDKTRWAAFNDFLRANIDSGRIIPLANNKYDAAYARFFTGREWGVIPSLCAYTEAQYTAKFKKFLYSSNFKRHPGLPEVVDKETALKRGYKWQELADYMGVIHIPYNVSTMSIFEQYTAGIPLFFPRLDFMKELYKKYNKKGVLSQLSWNQVRGLPPGSALFTGRDDDPNRYDNISTVMEWVKLADYYDTEMMPHIVYFDSFDHLKKLLRKIDPEGISGRMKESGRKRRDIIITGWQKVCTSLCT